MRTHRSLHNTRTNIHRNLFTAMTIQVVIRLILYTDQAIVREHPDMSVQGLGGMPYLCQTSYILLEYAISSMFMWMFIEGLFLHSVVTSNVLRERFSSTLFLYIGWGLPMIGAIAWAVVTAIHFKDETVAGCWFGYNFLPGYWILQGPRLTVILINFLFLLRIMRVLIAKINATESNQITAKKAVKGALVLLPLLGITNILNMIQPDSGPVWKFACWCYFTYGLRSLQGFFLSVIYCFSNAEVNAVLSKTYRDRIEERKIAERRARNTTAQRELRSWYEVHNRRWYICKEAIRTPFGKAYCWLRNLCSTPNTVQDVEIAMVTVREESND